MRFLFRNLRSLGPNPQELLSGVEVVSPFKKITAPLRGAGGWLLGSLLLLVGCQSPPPPQLVIYSARSEHLMTPLFTAYTEKTGVTISHLTDGAGPLIQRLRSEGASTPADIFIAVDAGSLWYAKKMALLQPLDPKTQASIPENLRDPEGYWIGLTARARTAVYHRDRVTDAIPTTYEDLANPRWKGRLLLRSARHVYNQSLVAMHIHDLGETKTATMLKGWVDNLAAPPFDSDTHVLRAIEAGQGDVGIVNSYYFGRYQAENPDTRLQIVWLDPEKGTHINISGAGITAHATHVAEANDFLTWLSSPEAQKILADSNHEFPVVEGVTPNPTVQAWGTFRQNPIPVHHYGEYQADAMRLLDHAGYR
jgi:iron(III) transport system substrate-binding protein